jgi:hypothetical protein
MLTQLLAQLSRPNCEIPQLVETVERDPMLSGQILRLANSAIFGRLRPMSSVRHAIAMIGTGALRKFALGSSISNLFSRTKLAKHFSLRRFNVHSVATATLLELLSGQVVAPESDGALPPSSGSPCSSSTLRAEPTWQPLQQLSDIAPQARRTATRRSSQRHDMPSRGRL